MRDWRDDIADASSMTARYFEAAIFDAAKIFAMSELHTPISRYTSAMPIAMRERFARFSAISSNTADMSVEPHTTFILMHFPPSAMQRLA